MLPIRIRPSANPITVIRIVRASALGATGLALIPNAVTSTRFQSSASVAAPSPFTALP